jgi:hypothetical protein
MKNAKPYQVECLTCRTSHLWRPTTPGEKPAPEAAPTTTRTRSGAPSARSTRVTPAQRHEQEWSKATLGRNERDFKAYNTTLSFREGELLRHKKFGDGIVTRVIDAHKVEVLFRDEARTLAQGLT